MSQLAPWSGQWIWSSDSLPKRNALVNFRRRFRYEGGKAQLRITADSRYSLFLNGQPLGFGPVRAWPNHWRYDEYDLAPELREGENVLAVLVNHYGEGTFQYLPAPEGLLAELELENETLVSDTNWRVRPEPALASIVPRISVQEAFEEQFDAQKSDAWTALDYDDSNWSQAVTLRGALDGPHQNLESRGIPFLTEEPILPRRLVKVDTVRSLPHRFTIYAKPYLTPDDNSSNFNRYHAYLATQVWAPQACDVTFLSPHKKPRAIKVNGELTSTMVPSGSTPLEARLSNEMAIHYASLREGWNQVLVSIRHNLHLPEYTLVVEGPAALKFAATGEQGGSPWAVVGPFDFSADEKNAIANDRDKTLVVGHPQHPGATVERGEAVWESGDVTSLIGEPWFQIVAAEHLPAEDVWLQACTDLEVEDTVGIENSEALLSGTDWTTIYPASDGSDVRILLDWGQEIIGFHRFEMFAPAGTILDCHNFEFIQPDGRLNLAEGMNNSFRYISREGFQTYQSRERRGFAYSFLILRNLTAPVKLRRVDVLFSTYPQANRGNFACSDQMLNNIWRVGAHTLRLCAEDTYTDCPTYEQTNWVGDARNEALVDWVINGDPRLWFRCLEQTGQSLERSPITESQVPSSWQNLLPAWSFLWMRSCREYLLFTGDTERGLRLLEFIEGNVKGIQQHLNDRGLFEIQAWNMFDWAPMDTPAVGVATHNNCFAVHALRDVADMAQELGQPQKADEWRILADSISRAVNTYLWNESKAAYTDCLRGDTQSEVFSQQTQTVAFMSGVAADHSQARATRCGEMIHHVPADFVHAGSPFFEFFLLEAYAREARDQDFLDTIRRDWGFMVEMGATTFWEMWSGRSGRLTRSHCHGWSAAPTFFLSTHVLGVRPVGVGFDPLEVAPHPGDLTWCRGTVPTPQGDISVQWEDPPEQPFVLRVQAPENLDVHIRLPRQGTATLNGQPVQTP